MLKVSSLCCAAVLCCAAQPASASEPESGPIDVSISYVVDAVAAASGGIDGKVRALDNLDLVADVDLERVLSWRGATAHVHVLNNMGARPNDAVGSLQGINNIEVSRARIRLFEAWIEQQIDDRTSLRVGLYDVNAEFYSNDAAGLLIAPAFGIGSEMASTGPNGPSIFPSTALGARVNRTLGASGYVRAAVLNANAGVLGDPGGVDLSLNSGVLAIAETGLETRGKIAIGYWRYTRRQVDIRDVALDGTPVRRAAQGAYLLVEYPLTADEGTWATKAFFRAGISDARTTAFAGGWQAGLLVSQVFAERPDSQLSIGINQGIVNDRFIANQTGLGVSPARAETQIELTYADSLSQAVTVQPDLQLVLNSGADRAADTAVIVGMRVGITF